MMAQSIQERIMDNIKTTVEGVTIGNGFNQTIVQVARKTAPAPKSKTAWPSADIWIDDIDKTSGQNQGHRDCRMIVMILAYTNDRPDPAQALSYLAADIEKALMVDHKRGALAIATEVLNVDPIFAEGKLPVPTGDVELEVEVNFRHRIDDPYST